MAVVNMKGQSGKEAKVHRKVTKEETYWHRKYVGTYVVEQLDLDLQCVLHFFFCQRRVSLKD